MQGKQNLLYSDSLHMLYDSFIRTYFTYCSTIWGNIYLQILSIKADSSTKENHKICQ